MSEQRFTPSPQPHKLSAFTLNNESLIFFPPPSPIAFAAASRQPSPRVPHRHLRPSTAGERRFLSAYDDDDDDNDERRR